MILIYGKNFIPKFKHDNFIEQLQKAVTFGSFIFFITYLTLIEEGNKQLFTL